MNGPFDLLSPDHVLATVEQAFGLVLDHTVERFPSYINRVYGVRTDDGVEYIAKFYRPDRWSQEAIAEEHAFLLDCAAAELPVVAPIADAEGDTLHEIEFAAGDDAGTEVDPAATRFAFALYPKRGGRGFDAEGDAEWYRLGSLIGRVHAVGRRDDAWERLTCTPAGSTRGFVAELRESGIVHPDLREEFFALAEEGLTTIEPLFADVPLQRIHGDFHRGNILERGDEGLLVIDFDDMLMGPAVQDLWLLLPDRIGAVRRELINLLEGYREFTPFEGRHLALVEPLRFMRILYYLAWNARQRNDYSFAQEHPEWGSKGFWIKEIEDLRTQLEYIREENDETLQL